MRLFQDFFRDDQLLVYQSDQRVQAFSYTHNFLQYVFTLRDYVLSGQYYLYYKFRILYTFDDTLKVVKTGLANNGILQNSSFDLDDWHVIIK